MAKNHSSRRSELPPRKATRSPDRTPTAFSALASRATRSASSPHERERSPKTVAVRCGATCAARVMHWLSRIVATDRASDERYVSTSNLQMLEETNPGGQGFPADLLIDLRPGSGRGVRERLAHGLRAAIQHGRLPGGTALPPTRVLAAELGISRKVVVEVYEHLTADG